MQVFEGIYDDDDRFNKSCLCELVMFNPSAMIGTEIESSNRVIRKGFEIRQQQQ